jgi:hypothetical protein
MSPASASASLPSDSSMPDLSHDVAQRSTLLRSEQSVPASELLPEQRLMIALVRDALRCIERYRYARDTRGRRLFAQEAQWVLSNDTDWLFAFARVCESLDLDPDAVRRTLRLAGERSEPSTSSNRNIPALVHVSDRRTAHA